VILSKFFCEKFLRDIKNQPNNQPQPQPAKQQEDINNIPSYNSSGVVDMADSEDLTVTAKSKSSKKDKGKKNKKDRTTDERNDSSSSSNSKGRRAEEKKPMSMSSDLNCDGEEEEVEEGEEYTLHKACWKGDLDVVKQILSTKSGLQQLNKRDPRGNPPLHIAIHLRHKEIINALLSAGVDPTMKNGGGWNSLQEAVASAERETAIQIYVASMQEMQNRFYRRVPDLLNAIENVSHLSVVVVWCFMTFV